MTWDTFLDSLYDQFVPWSDCEESLLRFESLRHGTMTILKYKIRFYQLVRYTIVILPTEVERVHWFVRGMVIPIR